MTHGLIVFAAILPLFIALDYLWLAVLMKPFYLKELGSLARTTPDGGAILPRLGAAAGVYLALPGGVVLFALPRADPANLAVTALAWGALYGVSVYSVYDLTNRATLRHWPVRLAAVDIAWGGTICAIATLAAAFIRQAL